MDQILRGLGIRPAGLRCAVRDGVVFPLTETHRRLQSLAPGGGLGSVVVSSATQGGQHTTGAASRGHLRDRKLGAPIEVASRIHRLHTQGQFASGLCCSIRPSGEL